MYHNLLIIIQLPIVYILLFIPKHDHLSIRGRKATYN